jgi:hypothetical protein
MDTLVEQMVLCGSMAQMTFVFRRATTLAGRRQKERHELCVSEPAESTVRQQLSIQEHFWRRNAPSHLDCRWAENMPLREIVIRR